MPVLPMMHKEMRALTIEDTAWGFVLRERKASERPIAWAEATLRLLGAALILAALGQWLLPGTLLVGEVIAMKLGLSAVLVAVGAGLFWWARRGFLSEFHVDLAERELRVASRNARGLSRVQLRVPMIEVESVFVQRTKEIGMPAHLFARLRGAPEALYIISAPEAELQLVHQRLCEDLRPLHLRIAERAGRRVNPLAERREAPARRHLRAVR